MAILSLSAKEAVAKNPVGVPPPPVLDLAICALMAVATVGLMLLAL